MDLLSQFTAHGLLDAALQQFYAFTLVLVRMSGLLAIGPVFGQSLVPANVRVLLVLTLSLLITPTLADQAQRGFERLDVDQNQLLTRDEIPEPLHPRFDALIRQTRHVEEEYLLPSEYAPSLAVPSTIVDYAWVGIGEFGLGLILGLGVLTILSGLQLAGQLIDQQTGVGLGEVFNPDLDIEGSQTGQTLFLLGTVAFLLLEPFAGHLRLIHVLLETFQSLPVGEAVVTLPAIDLLGELVHQSLILSIRVAAPLLAVMSLISLTMGFLGHSVPQINVLVVGFAVNSSLSFLILGLTIGSVGDVLLDMLPPTLDRLHGVLTFLP